MGKAASSEGKGIHYFGLRRNRSHQKQQLQSLFDLQLSTLSSGSLSPAQKVLASSSLDFWGEF